MAFTTKNTLHYNGCGNYVRYCETLINFKTSKPITNTHKSLIEFKISMIKAQTRPQTNIQVRNPIKERQTIKNKNFQAITETQHRTTTNAITFI